MFTKWTNNIKAVAMDPKLIIIQGTIRGLSFSCLAKCLLKLYIPIKMHRAKHKSVIIKSLDIFSAFL